MTTQEKREKIIAFCDNCNYIAYMVCDPLGNSHYSISIDMEVEEYYCGLTYSPTDYCTDKPYKTKKACIDCVYNKLEARDYFRTFIKNNDNKN